MSGINSASCVAGPLFQSSEPGLVIMAGSLYIHRLDYETAAQWISVLEKIPKKGAK